MRFAMCQELFEGWSWERQCRFLADVGYTGVEVAPFSLAPRITDLPVETRRTMRRQAEDCGLTVVGLHWLLAKTEGFHLTTSDPAVRKATSEYLVALGEACADLGGDLMVFGSPAQRSLEPGMTREQAYANAAEVFRTCLSQLADRGVRICMEPLTPQETDFVNTCADAVELIQMVDHPNFCLHQDVKAMLGAESDPIPVLIERHADILGHFHVNDTNLLGPGMGETDFRPIFEALLRVGYSGWVSVEAFDASPGIEKIARDSFTYMQETLRQVRGA
ncbi:MAG: sugar phosphate isomerase/epimerase [Planctomycetes bacterium]|nr:sugar phosphate isomerase/epimerase [Planctomycetota bacterium]